MFRKPVDMKHLSPKWLIIPAGLLLYLLLQMEEGKSNCKNACEVEGYNHFRYQPEYRSKYNATPERCTCLTEEESKIKSRIPKGIQLY